MNPKKSNKYTSKFICNKCNYKTNDKRDYSRHLQTRKHLDNNIYVVNNNCSKYICEYCENKYKHYSNLWKHKQKCIFLNEEKEEIKEKEKEQIPTELLLELLKQNGELQKQILELTTVNNSHNNSHNTTNNSHNNTNNFNLQFFLNETCKDAMNIYEFVEQLPIYVTDLEETARLGFVEGITRIFTRGLKEIDVSKRPIHCSDAKRETLYIKESDKWEKDDVNKSKLETLIRRVGTKNIRMIPEWKKMHPDCTDSDSTKNDLYLKIVGNSMNGGSPEEVEHNYTKIKRNIIRKVVIQK
jgi:hypothetical protein